MSAKTKKLPEIVRRVDFMRHDVVMVSIDDMPKDFYPSWHKVFSLEHSIYNLLTGKIEPICVTTYRVEYKAVPVNLVGEGIARYCTTSESKELVPFLFLGSLKLWEERNTLNKS